MDGLRIPSIIADKIRPQARETLLKVKNFVEEKCKSANSELNLSFLMLV
jgi:hypothetical protein